MATKTSKCTECGSTEDIIRGLCQDCEEHFVWCDCCKEWRPTGDECRHVFWTDCGYAGAGTHETDWDSFKEPFHAFLNVLSRAKPEYVDNDYPDVLTGLESELRKNAFFTFLSGPMIGGPPDLGFRRLRPDLPRHDGRVISLEFAEFRAAAFSGSDQEDEDVCLGFSWLQSLGADDTKAANRLTVQWIREWREAK